MTKLNQIKSLCNEYELQFTAHALRRSIERNIGISDDIIPAILSGEIIEEYPNDRPYKSYLILGTTADNRFLHIVCAIGEDILWIITEYFPNTDEWEDDFKTRKKVL